MQRHKIQSEASETSSPEDVQEGSYFTRAKPLEFISSGCTVLDCALGGGYPLGRMVNIVGDKSTGKTLLAIEACANFSRDYEKGKIFYRETEAAFDMGYAEALGMPVDKIDFGYESEDSRKDFYTVEDIFEDMTEKLEETSGGTGLYIVDSMDALSDRAEQAREIDKGTYGASKPKKISELFRRRVKQLENGKTTFMIISQVRDNIGVSFGDKHTRSGGRALDFYASQIVWLAHLGYIQKQVKGVKRPIGVQVKANIKKNKIALPRRQVEFPIMFGFGIDDLTASIEWLIDVKRISDVGLSEKEAKEITKATFEMGAEEYFTLNKKYSALIPGVWHSVEEGFVTQKRKY